MLKLFRRSKSRKQSRINSEAHYDSAPSNATPSSIDGSRPIESWVISTEAHSSADASNNYLPKSPGLGLHVLHNPEFSSLDIIFVHGLGGHSHKTWTKNHDSLLFWPKSWLPLEPDMGSARIITFGYNAKWRGEAGISNISDFAKELLYEMRFAKDASGEDIAIGVNPIIFVVHSMGGLVVKKAYMFGLHDDNYRDIIRSVSAIVFLSTPHRGTHLAETLNRILAVSFQSPKHFIADLEKNSTTIEDLNEQFRHLAPTLSLWSFYETLPTSIGLRKLMIVEKDSAVLGYPSEISRPLHADHRGVCKFASPADVNYLSVRNALKSLVSTVRSTAIREANAKEHRNIQALFRNCQTSEEDYDRRRRDWIPGTCDWFLQEPEVQTWIKPTSESRILWYSAPPASGKSVLSAFIINYLKNLGMKCQYFLFNYSDQRKRSVVTSLRALALQLAKDLPEFRIASHGSSPASLGFESTDPSLTWRNTFERVLFTIGRNDPIYWVIDALDESDSPNEFLECFRGLPDTKIPIRLLVLSRNTNAISAGFDHLKDATVQVAEIEQSDQLHSKRDIEHLIDHGIKRLGRSDAFKRQLTQTILLRSKGNFLWTKLVLEEIFECHTEEKIQEALGEIPGGMVYLYQRMEENLVNSARRSNQPLSRVFLEWTICAQRSLSIRELSQALSPEFSGFLDLKKTIQSSCGQFINADDNDTITMLHHTAREYFTNTLSSQFHINVRRTHERLFARTLTQLEAPDLRWQLIQSQHVLQASEPFVFYAAVNWPSHLVQSGSTSLESLEHLMRFFQSPALLDWVHALALLRQLEALVKASKALALFVHRMREESPAGNSILNRSSDLAVLDDWAIDLIKLVGKFGSTLATEPGVIYDIVPAFCPTKSALHTQYYDEHLAKIKILGITDVSWNDRLSRLVLPCDAQGWQIICAGEHIAVLASTGVVFIWDSSDFTEISKFSHGEPVVAITLSNNGLKLATYGLKTTKTWSVIEGELLTSTINIRDTKAKSIIFAENDEKLLIVGDDNVIRYMWCDDFAKGWRVVNPALLNEAGKVYGTNVNSPVRVYFNNNSSLVGASYRGAPLSVWRLADGRCLNRCRRAKDFQINQRQNSTNWSAVDRFTWNPVTNHIIGIYRDGCIFKWHPLTDENVEAQAAADEIAAGPNGKLFATSSSNGTVRIWNFASFSIIHQLSSDDLVMGLTFSPDSGRLYDLRGGSINAWKPTVLTSFLESEGDVSGFNKNYQSDQTPNTDTESHVRQFETVTALAPAHDGSAYCVGHEDGTVILFQKGKTESFDFAQFHNFLNVEHIRWSTDEKYVAVADLAGEVQVKSLHQTSEGLVEISSLPAPQIELGDSNIAEILFSLDSELLFISTRSNGFIFRVRDGAQQSCCALHPGGLRRWLPHPTQPSLLLAFGTADVLTYTWIGLENISYSVYSELQRPGLTSKLSKAATEPLAVDFERFSFSKGTYSETSVINVILSHDTEYVLVNTKTVSKGTNRQTFIFPAAVLDMNAPSNGVPSSLDYLQIPTSISSQIKISLGALPGPRLVFFDHDLWLCTYFLGCSIHSELLESYDRHYFLPRDWVGAISIENSSLARDGTLFWPRDDGVALIECNFDEPRVNYMYQRWGIA
ncbi:WD40 repeat-containing protein [Trichoderma barbatum]